MTDLALFQANPLAMEIEAVYKNIIGKRKKAIDMEGSLTNFKTKHLNIFLDGDDLEVYISLDDLRKSKVPNNSYDWTG